MTTSIRPNVSCADFTAANTWSRLVTSSSTGRTASPYCSTRSLRVSVLRGGRCDLIATFEGGEDELAAKAFRCAGDEPNFAHDVNPVLVWTATVTCSAACCWCAGVSVRMVRSLAVCWSIACGPLPVSKRTDGSQASCGAEMLGEDATVKPASLMATSTK